MKRTHQTDLGELIATIYAELLALYGDEELASVATSAVINDLLTRPRRDHRKAA